MGLLPVWFKTGGGGGGEFAVYSYINTQIFYMHIHE